MDPLSTIPARPFVAVGAGTSDLDHTLQLRGQPCVLIADSATRVIQQMEGNTSRSKRRAPNAREEQEEIPIDNDDGRDARECRCQEFEIEGAHRNEEAAEPAEPDR